MKQASRYFKPNVVKATVGIRAAIRAEKRGRRQAELRAELALTAAEATSRALEFEAGCGDVVFINEDDNEIQAGTAFSRAIHHGDLDRYKCHPSTSRIVMVRLRVGRVVARAGIAVDADATEAIRKVRDAVADAGGPWAAYLDEIEHDATGTLGGTLDSLGLVRCPALWARGGADEWLDPEHGWIVVGPPQGQMARALLLPEPPAEIEIEF